MTSIPKGRDWTIALDAMGGDHAPEQIVEGAIQVAPQLKGRLVIVGDEARVRPLLTGPMPANVTLRHASQTVDMAEKPTEAYRTKRDSSLYIATQMVKTGEAEAMVSAGNTGAATAFSHLSWRTLPGVHRPAIISRMPNRHNGFVLLDCGASPDVSPEHLVEFAHMGLIYARSVMKRPDAKVHLLNIGEEAGKGNAFAQIGRAHV